MITPGNHLYVGPDGCWRSAGPDDRFFFVDGPNPLLAQLQTVLHTGDATSIDGHPVLAAALEGWRARGLATPLEPEPTPTFRDGSATATVLLDGGGPVAELLVDVVGDQVAFRDGPVDDAAIAEVDLVVSCAGWLPDAGWQDLGARCAAHRTPWHMTYLEGDAAIVGPIFLPDRTANYADVRGRRLAASATPDELLAFWGYLDGTQPKPPAPWPDCAWAAVIAGIVAADVLSALRGVPCPTEAHQLAIIPARAEVRRHHVLPLPKVAVLPDPRVPSSR